VFLEILRLLVSARAFWVISSIGFKDVVVAGMTLVRLLLDDSPADLDPMMMFGWPSEASGGSAVMLNIRLLD
jgi:hypothetical protein